MSAQEYMDNAMSFKDNDWAFYDDEGSCECLLEVYVILRNAYSMSQGALDALERIAALIEANAILHAAQCEANREAV
jgi:hypothetical protein